MHNKNTIPDELNNALGFNIYRTALLYKRELIQALSDYELTPEQWQTLAVLWLGEDPRSQGEIAELTMRDKHSVSRLIARMEQNGWVTRFAHAKDKRITMIKPTKKANESREEIVKALQLHFVPINSVLTKEENVTLLELLKKLRGYLED
ncbi:MAG: MarR family transcriptional regulator [Gammaproteobacteria bacterium]|nr:MarR family transcriptional regulator [Gammaproteobacteria bacterium]